MRIFILGTYIEFTGSFIENVEDRLGSPGEELSALASQPAKIQKHVKKIAGKNARQYFKIRRTTGVGACATRKFRKIFLECSAIFKAHLAKIKSLLE